MTNYTRHVILYKKHKQGVETLSISSNKTTYRNLFKNSIDGFKNKISSFFTGGKMSTYTQYTGTFIKTDGSKRTMNFIKVSDLPDHLFSAKQRKESDGEIQVVYDTDVNDFRVFNRGRVIGEVQTRTVNYNFSK